MIELVREAVDRLARAGVAPEVLGRRLEPRRVLGVGRARRVVAVGSAWRLGALLLTRDGELATSGSVVRAAPAVRRGFPAQATRDRADLGAAAVRGGIAPGSTVHLDWQWVGLSRLAVDGEAGPLLLAGGDAADVGAAADHDGGAADPEVLVRWSQKAQPVPLTAWLRERCELAIAATTGDEAAGPDSRSC